jgi:hypothetical protein
VRAGIHGYGHVPLMFADAVGFLWPVSQAEGAAIASAAADCAAELAALAEAFRRLERAAWAHSSTKSEAELRAARAASGDGKDGRA